jgi:hypothetical protein
MIHRAAQQPSRRNGLTTFSRAFALAAAAVPVEVEVEVVGVGKMKPFLFVDQLRPVKVHECLLLQMNVEFRKYVLVRV